MNFNYFFISYSVIYTKYNYCYEVPRDKPTRYFDGKDWKIMKARQSIRTKAPRHSRISVDLGWAELIKEIKEYEFDETATPMPSCGMSITDTTEKATVKRAATTKRKATVKIATTTKRKATVKRAATTKRKATVKTAATTKRKATVKIATTTKRKGTVKRAATTKRKATVKKATTTKRTTTIKRATTAKRAITKKITTKIAATPKILIERLRRNTHSSTMTKALPKHCRPVCKLKLKNATTTKIDPRLLQMTTFVDWRDNWNYMRPTKKPSPVTPNKFTAKATTKIFIQTTQKVTMTTTRKPVVTTKKPVMTTKVLTKTKMPVKCSGKQESDGTSTGNWSNLLMEFLKFVESKKCEQPPCESVISTSTMPYLGYRAADNRNSMSDNDDLMNILMDGVQIDDRRNEEDDYTSQSKDSLEYQSQGLNYESAEGSAARNSIINNDFAEAFDHKSLKDSIINRGMEQDAQFQKKMGHLKKTQAIKVNKDFVNSRFRGSESYSNELQEENAKKDEENLIDSFTISYLDALQDMRASKNYKISGNGGSKAYFDELKDKTANKEDNVLKDNKIKYYSNALKDKHAQKELMTSRNRGSELNEISQNSIKKSYSVALIDNMFTGIRESNIHLQDFKDANTQKENEIVQDSELKFYINALKDKHAKKDYVNPRTRESDRYPDELKNKDAKVESDVLQDGELKSYINALKDNHAKKDYVSPRTRGSKAYLDALKDNNVQKENEFLQNNELKFYVDAFKDKHAKKENQHAQIIDKSSSYLDPENSRQQDEVNLQDETTETFNSKELNEIADYVEPSHVSSVELRSKTNKEDVLQDSDITFDLEA